MPALLPCDPAPVRALLRSFRAQRPLRAGSLLITVFGDAIAPRGGAVTLGSLIRLAAPFGLTERLVRTSVARLAREGWLTARRAGRRSEYRLSSDGARRFAQATQRIYGAGPARWDGRWTLVLLGAAVRAPKIRRELRWLGFGQLSATVLAHPACSPQQGAEWLIGAGLAQAPLLLSSTTQDLACDQALARQGWDLAQLARRYRGFVTRFAPAEAALRGGKVSPQGAFLVRTLLIHEYRKIHLQDPLLPPELLPAQWVGHVAYELCGRLYAQVFGLAESQLSAVAHCLERPLPPVSRGTTESRFNGVIAGTLG